MCRAPISLIVASVSVLLSFHAASGFARTAVETDSLVYAGSAAGQDGFLKRYWRSLVYGNVDRTHEKRFDVSYGLAPTYTKEGSFGLGGTMTGLYRLDMKDSLMAPSYITVSGSASLKGFYVVEADGTTYFSDRVSKLIYKARFSRKDLDFWGIRYDECAANPMSRYVRTQVKVDADYIHDFGRGVSLGAGVRMNWTGAADVGTASYLDGQNDSYILSGAAFSFVYDSRDIPTDPHKGIYASLKGTLWPEFLSNSGRTDFTLGVNLCGYLPLWKGGVLAGDLYLAMNDKDCPWTIREELGGVHGRMRGYYAGRYIDCCQAVAQVELRQRIYKRLGGVVWGGCGTVFPNFKGFRRDDILPTYGLGLRLEYKNNINLRVDLGLGKDTWGFSFGFSEAF